MKLIAKIPRFYKRLIKALPIHTTKAILITSAGLVLVAAGSYTAVRLTNHNKHQTSIVTASRVKSATVKQITLPQYIAGASCQTSQLSLAPVMEVGGDLSGEIGGVFSLTNTSNTECVIDGYPTTQIGSFSTTGNGSIDGLTDPGPARVTLTPGTSAYFGVGWWFQNFNYGGLSTGCITGASISVIPPNTKSALSTNVQLGTVCPGYQSQGAGNTTAIRLPLAFNIDFSCQKDFYQPFPGMPTLPSCPAPTTPSAPKPITLLDFSGTEPASSGLAGTSACTQNVAPIPLFTPTTDTYVVNVTYTSIADESPDTGTMPTIYLSYPPPNPLGVSPTAWNFTLAVKTYGSGQFSADVAVPSGGLTPVQFNISCAPSWHITVTENSQPLYAVVQ
jgi:hypothetical protein